MTAQEIKETIAYYKKQAKAMKIRGGDFQAFLDKAKKYEKQLKEIEAK